MRGAASLYLTPGEDHSHRITGDADGHPIGFDADPLREGRQPVSDAHPEREREIADAWHDRQDRTALDELVGSHLRLVVKIAAGFAGYRLPLADLVAEGNIGLLQAAAKFEPQRGFRFSTYATWWVRAAMQEYILCSWSLVKIGTTSAQKKLFYNLRRLRARIEGFEHGDISPETVAAIAHELDVSEADVVQMNARLLGADNSLNAHRSGDTEDEWIERLADDQPSQETTVGDAEESRRRHVLLDRALLKLGAREREIVVERRLKDDPASLGELSDRFAVSRERIRQIEIRAVDKLQKSIIAAQDTRDIRQTVRDAA